MKTNQNIAVLLTSVFEKQIAIRELADQLAREYDDIKDSDRSKAVAISELADKQQVHLNDLENKLESIGVDTSDHAEPDQPTIASIHAISRREARGDDLKSQDYKSLYIERGDNLESCIRTLEEIKAIADLLAMSTGDGIPSFYDETLEHVGCLIIDRVTATMDKINNGGHIS